MSIAEGTLIAGRYEVTSLLGRGGMAEVYLGMDRVLRRPVAVKVIASALAEDPAFVARFQREALAVARVNHPNLVSVFDAGADHDLHYIVMEYVEGHTLAEEIQSNGPLPPERAAGIAADVAAGLEAAHQAGLVHRDVKPGNVLLTASDTVKVTDLGIARSLHGTSLTGTGIVLGSAPYLSPEQAQGLPVDQRSDVYSLGCVLFEMLTGRAPFAAESAVAVAYRHVHDPPEVPSRLVAGIPPTLDAVVLRALQKDPDARFPSAAAMADELRRGVDGGQTVAAGTTRAAAVPTRPLAAAPPTTPLTRPVTVGTGRPPHRARRWLVPAVVAGVLAIVLVAVLLALLVAGGGGRPAASPPPSRTATHSPQPSPSPSSSPSPSPSASPTPLSVRAAYAALAGTVNQGVRDGTVSKHASDQILHGARDIVNGFDHGAKDLDHKVQDLRKTEQMLVEHGDISSSTEARAISAAIDQLAAAVGVSG